MKLSKFLIPVVTLGFISAPALSITSCATVKIESIEIQGSSQVSAGKTTQLQAIITPSGATKKSLDWVVTNGEEFATVDANGLVTGVKDGGSATIVAKAKDGSGVESNPFTIEVTDVLTEQIVISGAKAVTHHSKTQLTAKCLPEGASQSVTWTITSGGDFAKVDKSGNVSGEKPGDIVVTATANDGSGVSTSWNMTVTPLLVNSIEITNKVNQLIVGDTHQLGVKVLPENATDKTVTWTSNNSNVLRVDVNGKMTAVASGRATITATAHDGSGKVDNISVVVSALSEFLGYIVLEDGTKAPFDSFTKTHLCDEIGEADIEIGNIKYNRFKFNYPIILNEKAAKWGIPDYFMAMNPLGDEEGHRSEFNSTVTLPESIDRLNAGFMAGNINFNTELKLPNSITNIGIGFMADCINYNKSLNIPNSIKTISEGFMSNCRKFNQQLILPNGLETIAAGFMAGCVKFNQEIAFPTTLKDIGSLFLVDCTDFNQDVTLPSGLQHVGAGFLANVENMSEGSIKTLDLNGVYPWGVFEEDDLDNRIVTLGDREDEYGQIGPLSQIGVKIVGDDLAVLEFLAMFPSGSLVDPILDPPGMYRELLHDKP